MEQTSWQQTLLLKLSSRSSPSGLLFTLFGQVYLLCKIKKRVPLSMPKEIRAKMPHGHPATCTSWVV